MKKPKPKQSKQPARLEPPVDPEKAVIAALDRISKALATLPPIDRYRVLAAAAVMVGHDLIAIEILARLASKIRET